MLRPMVMLGLKCALTSASRAWRDLFATFRLEYASERSVIMIDKPANLEYSTIRSHECSDGGVGLSIIQLTSGIDTVLGR
jgi:MinD-like ATPase involved in chromosome partitioning or flagellar assembly